MRKNAAEALGEIGDVRAVEPLVIALKGEDVSVRKMCNRGFRENKR